MKTLLAEVRKQDLIFFACLALVVIGCTLAAIALDRADFQHRIDRSALKTVAEIKDEIRQLRDAVGKSRAERERISKTVDRLEAEVKAQP
jgi:hypothetical protein